MRTFDSPASRSASLVGRLMADVRVLRRIVGMAFGYWTVGGRVRRDLRAAERAGATYWLDDAGVAVPSGERDEGPQR